MKYRYGQQKLKYGVISDKIIEYTKYLVLLVYYTQINIH